MAATSDENAALTDGGQQNATIGEPQDRSAVSGQPKNAGFVSGLRKIRSLSDAGLAAPSADTAIRDVSNQSLDGRRRNSETGLSKVLLKHIRSLADTEKELQEREERQRLEHLVRKVEDEVEYEGILDEMSLRVRAEDEALEMERREREWEFERREVRLEEEVEVLKGKIRKLEEELRVSHVEKNYLMHRKQDEVEEVVQRLLCELKDDESIKSMFRDEQVEEQIKSLFSAAEEDASEFRSQEILSAFEDMLREADERHEREKRLLESTIRAKEEAAEGLRHDRQKLRVRENQMQCQVLVLEKEVARLSSLLREKDACLVAERERRRDLQEEAERFSSMLKEERGAQKVAVAKLKKLEIGMQKLKEKVVREHAEVCRDVEKEIGRLLLIFNQKKEVPRTEAKQFEVLRNQRDAAVADRDKLEEKLNLLLKRSRDREAEIDTMWLERERILIEKIADIEEQAEKWEKKCRKAEAELLHEQRTWELSVRDVSSQGETPALEAVLREAEARHKEEEERLSCLIEAKDCELHTLKAMQRKLVDALALNKKRVDEMRELVRQRAAGGEVPRHVPQTTGSEESEAESCIDIEGVATEMEMELSRLSQELKSNEENLERERDELKADAERLRRELEKEVGGRLEAVEQLKREVASKESQLERQKEQFEAAAAVKAAEVEILRKKIEANGLEMHARAERFRSEVNMMQQEVETERRERERLMDLHLALKQKMSTEVRIKEEVWEKDMERTMQDLASLRAELRKKNEDLETLTKERVEQELNLAEERRNWVAAEKEQEIEISRLRQENVELLQRLREIENNLEVANELGSVWSARESIDERRNVEWQFALERVAVFDKQITEAMRSIQSLREELTAKEAELLKARAEPEAEWERREEECEREQERERQQVEWRKREEALLAEKAELLKLLETERSEAADGIACLRGTVRELRWSLMQKEEESLGNRENSSKHLKGAEDGGMVKVHANHFKDVDQYICDLKSKVEELEKQLTIAKNAKKKEPGLAEARLSPDRRRLVLMEDRPGTSIRKSPDRSLIKSQHDQPWNCEAPLSCLHKFPGQDIVPSSVAVQRQKKWIVDASWMEQVRKEHLVLTQQLMIERQRVAALGQAEADRRCMEAMMLRALEQQKESEIKLLQLQEKISFSRA